MNGPERFHVAILAGGAGSRLKSRTGGLPKSMVHVAGRPLLAHHVALCRTHGFTRILLLVHHGHEVIERHFGDGSQYGVSIACQVEETSRGTAGALRDALPRLADTFLVLYGDTFLDVNLRAAWDAHVSRRADTTVFVHPNDHPADSDLVEVDSTGWINRIHPYPHPPDLLARNVAAAALFVMRSEPLLTVVPESGSSDLVKHALPAMVHAGRKIAAYRSPEYIKDAGTPERLDQVERDVAAGLPDRLSARTSRLAVFLDRDGTINEEVDYLSRIDQMVLMPGAGPAVRRLNHAGRLTVVITNQSVVARGALTMKGLNEMHAKLDQLLGAERAYLDALYACPHHPDGGFAGEVSELKIACTCRKPGTGSIDNACKDLGIDRAASWLVGDTTIDIETGVRAGVRTVLVRTGHGGQDGRYPFRPDYVVANLAAAVDWMLEGHAVVSARIARVSEAAARARLVLVGGLARSGKSFAAQVLKEAFGASGRRAHVLAMDSWLKPKAERTEGTGVASRFDLPGLTAFLTDLLAARQPQTINVPAYDRARRAMYDRPVPLSISPDDVLIVEGVPALLSDPLVTMAQVRVHVETAESQRLAHLRADYASRGEAEADVDRLIASRALDETEVVARARATADFVVTAWGRA